MFMHLIDAEDIIKDLSGPGKMNAVWKFLPHLFEICRDRAEKWPVANFDGLGIEAIIDLHSKDL